MLGTHYGKLIETKPVIGIGRRGCHCARKCQLCRLGQQFFPNFFPITVWRIKYIFWVETSVQEFAIQCYVLLVSGHSWDLKYTVVRIFNSLLRLLCVWSTWDINNLNDSPLYTRGSLMWLGPWIVCLQGVSVSGGLTAFTNFMVLHTFIGRRSSLLVSELDFGLRRPRFEPWPGSLCCVLGQDI